MAEIENRDEQISPVAKKNRNWQSLSCHGNHTHLWLCHSGHPASQTAPPCHEKQFIHCELWGQLLFSFACLYTCMSKVDAGHMVSMLIDEYKQLRQNFQHTITRVCVCIFTIHFKTALLFKKWCLWEIYLLMINRHMVNPDVHQTVDILKSRFRCMAYCKVTFLIAAVWWILHNAVFKTNLARWGITAFKLRSTGHVDSVTSFAPLAPLVNRVLKPNTCEQTTLPVGISGIPTSLTRHFIHWHYVNNQSHSINYLSL